jgi:hypothetical protein
VTFPTPGDDISGSSIFPMLDYFFGEKKNSFGLGGPLPEDRGERGMKRDKKLV